jgi:hypothetical protein
MQHLRVPSRRFALFAITAVAHLLCGATCAATEASVEPDVIDVESVWSGHPVGFCLLTHPPHQFVAYYDSERRMTVAQRTLGDTAWTFTKLPSQVGWDSHNYITMTVDRAGYLHLAGNMHCVPLIYFRSENPLDASSLTPVPNMAGPQREQRVTYPVFMRGPTGALIFRYRDGKSGSGDDIYNVYNASTRTWRRLMDQPLTSGEGKMNAYCSRPVLGPDSWYHIIWVWRDTPDCATNHDLSYARSRDMVVWQAGDGRKLTLPITIGQKAVVDPVPPSGGIINGGARLAFDSRHRPIITYHKYDANGHTRPFAARLEDGNWVIRPIDDWGDYRWEFSGGGSIRFGVSVSQAKIVEDGVLRVDWRNERGRGTIWLDEATLTPTEAPKTSAGSSAKAKSPSSTQPAKPAPDPAAKFPGIQSRSAGDSGQSGTPGVRYELRWFTLGPNRDRPCTGPLPPASILRVIRHGGP